MSDTPTPSDGASEFRRLWNQLAPVGRLSNGGYRRFSWTPEHARLRSWFVEQAELRDLKVETDANGNMFATWGTGDDKAVLTGSHFDSVPGGGAYDGPLGIVSAFLAIDRLREEGFTPSRPITVADFVEEEGGRFGVPCLGSRLSTGAVAPDKARSLTDADGTTYAEALTAAGFDPDALGQAPQPAQRFERFVELHVEQGKSLVYGDRAVGVASAIWPHGRWRFDFTGEGDHAGTTHLTDRRDPMLTFAFTVLAARKAAAQEQALATVGRVAVDPGATNAIAAHVSAWLDARAPDEETLGRILSRLDDQARQRAVKDGTEVAITCESQSAVVNFDHRLRDRISELLGDAPILPTGAGHDAGVLSTELPTAMLFVRNPSGVSHAPAEGATDEDCGTGVQALATVLKEFTR
ncbi:allantoate amidohydrolase [Haloglycomyces albus]|uniref:allantoate amidohydrolase n=1 Tax=Haloglycomyces albus TaxID=526067 RepID=UPI00046CE1C7|nr:allantoate amidohydrolase [Haloglycomyces albus]